LIKNFQPFGNNFQKTLGGGFFDSHCRPTSDHKQKYRAAHWSRALPIGE